MPRMQNMRGIVCIEERGMKMSAVISERLAMLMQKHIPGWVCENEIGCGTSGRVYRVFRMDGDLKYTGALKWVQYPSNAEIDVLQNRGMSQKDIVEYCKQMMTQLQKEISVMSKLQGNSHIVNMTDHCIIPRVDVGFDLLIRMELLTPVTQLVQDMTMNDVIKMGIDICEALKVCRAQDVLHRDIKPENIFRNELGNYKLGDFGVSYMRAMNRKAHVQQGTPLYMAPEVCTGAAYDDRADIYSFGLVLFELLNGQQPPFCDYSLETDAVEQENKSIERRMKGEELPAPMQITKELLDVILKACEYDAEERYMHAEALQNALRTIALKERADEKLIVIARKQTAVVLRNESPKPDAEAVEATAHSYPRDTQSLSSGRQDTDIEEEDVSYDMQPSTQPEPTVFRDEEIPEKKETWKIAVLAAAVLMVLVVVGVMIFGKGQKNYKGFSFKQDGLEYKLSWNGGGTAPWQIQIKSAQGKTLYNQSKQQRKAELTLEPSDSYMITINGADGQEGTWTVIPDSVEYTKGTVKIDRARLYRYKIWLNETPDQDIGKQIRNDIVLDDTLGKEKGTGYFIRYAYQLNQKKAQKAEVYIFYGTKNEKITVELQPTEEENKYFLIVLNEVLSAAKQDELVCVVTVDKKVLEINRYAVEQ